MGRDALSTQTVRRIYDRLGRHHDWGERYEGRAKARALQLLNARPGQRALNVGVGTGLDHRRLQAAVLPGGVAVGLDLSAVMAALTRARTGAPVCLADARRLPVRTGGVDRLLCTYVLDLLPAGDLPVVLGEFWRVLVPGGRVVLVTLTEGVSMASRAVIAAWKALYAISPIACFGCRPLQLAGVVDAAGFVGLQREVVVQLGVPSQVIVAVRP
jgi:ubiquinone/menaquinone biosynthesis C-methylase UbiE